MYHFCIVAVHIAVTLGSLRMVYMFQKILLFTYSFIIW